MDNSIDAFLKAVKESCESHATRKGYTKKSGDEGDILGPIMRSAGIVDPHGIGEIMAKSVEYLKSPRRVLLEKIAGWSYVLWRDCEKP